MSQQSYLPNKTEIIFSPDDYELDGESKCVTLQHLCSEKCRKEPMFNTYIVIFCLMVRHADNNNSKNRISNKFGGDERKGHDRQITAMCVNSKAGYNACLILIGTHKNEADVFSNNIRARDYPKGFGPGSLIVILNPTPITESFGSDERRIPILKFSGGMHLVDWDRIPKSLKDIPADTSISSKEKLTGFFYKKVKILLLQGTFLTSTCKGNLCDSLDQKPGVSNNKKCACYKHITHYCSSLLSLRLLIEITGGSDSKLKEIQPEQFVSRSFNNLVFQDKLPVDESVSELDKKGITLHANKKLQSMFNAGNEKEGYSILGWFRRGRFADPANSNQDSSRGEKSGSVSASDVIYHISHIRYNGNTKDISEHFIDLNDFDGNPAKKAKIVNENGKVLDLTGNGDRSGNSGVHRNHDENPKEKDGKVCNGDASDGEKENENIAGIVNENTSNTPLLEN